MNKAKLSNILRGLGLIRIADDVRFYVMLQKNRRINRQFRLKFPSFRLPPPYLIYESYQMSYDKYYSDGLNTAEWIIQIISKYSCLTDERILDWGCGPGRVIRHLPKIVSNGCKFYGTDFNEASIEWCRTNIKGIQFHCNSLLPDLPYENNFFDIIYGLSIFTHLSEAMHFAWIKELKRILKPGDLMLFTTQGANFRPKLTDAVWERFELGNLIVRGGTKEGHRTYSAFHPESFMMQLFYDLEILEHLKPKPEPGAAIPQDVWVLKKPKSK